MSSVSVSSSKREKQTSEKLVQELQSIRGLNSSLKAYLDVLKLHKKSLFEFDEKCRHLKKVHTDWVETLDLMNLKRD